MSGSPRSCSAPRSPPATATAARAGSRPPGSRPARRWRSSTSPSNARVKKTVIEHLGQLDFLHGKRERDPARTARHRQNAHRDRARRSAPASPANACSSRPRPNGSPGSAKPNAKASSRPSCGASSFIPLIVVDEVGYIPFDPEAANLMFSLVSNRYERASMIVTSNKPFSAWGEIFGDDMAATAMIDRLIHHAEILIPQRRQLPATRQRPRRPPTPRPRRPSPDPPARRAPPAFRSARLRLAPRNADASQCRGDTRRRPATGLPSGLAAR